MDLNESYRLWQRTRFGLVSFKQDQDEQRVRTLFERDPAIENLMPYWRGITFDLDLITHTFEELSASLIEKFFRR
jgi:hypothetical protein